jgi:large subunit ribosomal protein L18
MDKLLQKKNALRQRRAMHVRKRVKGTAARPRLSVHKSHKHIQVQLIDDENQRTLAGTATYAEAFRTTEFNSKNVASAKALGSHIGELAKKLNIQEVVFDRGSFKYHGILAELADAARAAGLKF